MNIDIIGEKDGYILRAAKKEDAENYYQQNYNPLDPEVARLTGCKPSFTHDEVVNFFLSCIDNEDRYDFLIVSPDGNIIGESVLRDAIKDGDTYADDILMAILEDEWKASKQ